MITTDKAQERPATYQEMANLIDKSEEWAIGSLLTLYQMQTLDEQNIQGTLHQNSVGFNSCDAGFMSSLAQWYLTKGFLTERQLSFVRKTLKKYATQLLSLGVEPVTKNGKAPVTKPEVQAIMKAILLTKKADGQPSGIQVEFNFPKGDNRFADILTKVKTLPDRKFEADSKSWRVGLSLEAGDKLQEWGFQFSEALQKWHDGLKGMIATEIQEVQVPGLKGTPYPYQLQGISFIESRKGRALIADEQGLGKTLQALGYCQLHPEQRPIIIVCPAGLKENWKRECNIWLSNPGNIQIISGKKNGYDLYGDIIIINYDILTSWQEAIMAYCQGKNAILIGDEIHYCKSSSTIRTKAMKKLSKTFKYVIHLTGTPIDNETGDIYNPINMIRPDLFPSYWRFMEEFTNKVKNYWSKSGYSFQGSKNAAKLHKLLTETIMIRRKKDEVLKDLPPKIHSILPLEIDNRKEYDQAATDIISWILKNEGKAKAEKASRAQVMVEFEKLKQLAVKGKMSACIEWIKDFLETGKKLVIFTMHTKTLEILEETFPKTTVRIDGSTPQKDRKTAEYLFQKCATCGIPHHEHNIKEESCDKFTLDMEKTLLLGNVKAAGVGINLTASSYVFHMELPWTPGALNQASDRCHRIGQKDTVNIWMPVALDTVEEKIASILTQKQQTTSLIIDGKEADESTVLTELINAIKEGKCD